MANLVALAVARHDRFGDDADAARQGVVYFCTINPRTTDWDIAETIRRLARYGEACAAERLS